MNNPFRVGFALVVLAVILKFTIDSLDSDNSYYFFAVILFLLLATYLGLRGFRMIVKADAQQPLEEITGIMDFKAALKGGALFALPLFVFNYIYYGFINPNYFANLTDERVAEVTRQATANGWTAEQIEKQVEGVRILADNFLQPFTFSSMVLFAMIMMSVFYAIVFTTMAQKLPKSII